MKTKKPEALDYDPSQTQKNVKAVVIAKLEERTPLSSDMTPLREELDLDDMTAHSRDRPGLLEKHQGEYVAYDKGKLVALAGTLDELCARLNSLDMEEPILAIQVGVDDIVEEVDIPTSFAD